MPTLKEQLQRIISTNYLSNETNACILLKESVKEILLDLMEAEMAAALGYHGLQKGNLHSSNHKLH